MCAMTMKKAQQQAQKVAGKDFGSFVGGVKEEFHKITWTSKEELAVYTRIVVTATFALGFVVYSYDLIIRGALLLLNLLVRWIAG